MVDIIEDSNEKFLEIEEIQIFLKQYLKENGYSLHSKYFNNQQNILDIIEHYFPKLKCEESKYIHGIKLLKWNKKEDVMNFKESYINENKSIDKIEKIYTEYCKYKRKKSEKDTIVKIYFYQFLQK